MDTVDSGGREAEALAGTGDDPPLFQKEAVQFPQVLCGKLREPLLSQAVLGVSPSSGYELMHEPGFPVLRIGNRMVVPKEQFIQWVKEHTGGGV